MNKIIHNYQELFFNIFIYISYFSIILSAIGFPELTQKYLPTIDYYIRIYICLFLIIRFNPLKKKYEFTSLDRKISFSAGLLIFTTTALNKYLEILKSKTKEIINKERNKELNDYNNSDTQEEIYKTN
jgi:hypothetical protein